MHKIFNGLLALALLSSCNSKKPGDQPGSDKKEDTTAAATPAAVAPNPFEKMLGSYVGAFGDNKITLLVTRITADSVAGRSIVGGNDRPFAGTYSIKGGTWNFHAAEPGDHKDDGVFDFAIDETRPDTATGTWKPNDARRPAKTYALSRKRFEYRTDVGDYPDASQRLLKPEDVENLMKEDLEFMRNEIFARHGYCFNKKHLRQQFEMQDWYVPNTVDIKGFLTDIEKKNIALIKRYEKYAEEYGDEYGR